MHDAIFDRCEALMQFLIVATRRARFEIASKTSKTRSEWQLTNMALHVVCIRRLPAEANCMQCGAIPSCCNFRSVRRLNAIFDRCDAKSKWVDGTVYGDNEADADGDDGGFDAGERGHGDDVGDYNDDGGGGDCVG